ncbi:hypothetical protein Esti_001975 [Eimeria stiedai]
MGQRKTEGSRGSHNFKKISGVVLQLQHQKARGHRGRKRGEEGEEENPQTARLEETEVVFHVKLGRTLRLLLVSKGVNAHSPFLFCPPLVKVEPVPIGRPEGCWRSFMLHNKGDVAACWQIAASPTEGARIIGNELLALAPHAGVLAARSAVYVHVCLSLAQQGNHVFPLVVKYGKYALEGSSDAVDTEGKTEQTLSFNLATTGYTDTPVAVFGGAEEEDAAAAVPLSALPHAAVSLPLNAKLTLERLVFEPRPFRTFRGHPLSDSPPLPLRLLCTEWKLTSLVNGDASREMRFAWDLSDNQIAQISVFPQQGVLKAGESCLVWICLHVPSFEVKLKQVVCCCLSWADDSKRLLKTDGDYPPAAAAAAAASSSSSKSSSKNMASSRKLTASSARRLCSSQVKRKVQQEITPFIVFVHFCVHARAPPEGKKAVVNACMQAAERQPAFPAASGAPCTLGPPLQAIVQVGEAGSPGRMHAVEGPLFLLIEAETSQLLEKQMQVTHRDPPRLPFIQQPHQAGGGPPRGGFEGALKSGNQAEGPLLTQDGSLSNICKIQEVALQKRLPLPPRVVGDAAATLCNLILNDILGERGTEELLEDLVAEETIPVTTLFLSSCRYTPIHPLGDVSHQQTAATETAAAATIPTTLATTSARDTDSGQCLLFYAEDYRLWSPLAGHFQHIQTSAFQARCAQAAVTAEATAAAAAATERRG